GPVARVGPPRGVRRSPAPLGHAVVQDVPLRGPLAAPLPRDPAPRRRAAGQLLAAAPPVVAVLAAVAALGQRHPLLQPRLADRAPADRAGHVAAGLAGGPRP